MAARLRVKTGDAMRNSKVLQPCTSEPSTMWKGDLCVFQSLVESGGYNNASYQLNPQAIESVCSVC